MGGLCESEEASFANPSRPFPSCLRCKVENFELNLDRSVAPSPLSRARQAIPVHLKLYANCFGRFGEASRSARAP